MDSNTLEVIYTAVSVIGYLVYVYTFWKKSGKPFDISVALDSAASGVLGVIVAAGGLVNMGLSIVGLFTAFFFAWGIDQAHSAVIKATASQPVAQAATSPTCPLTGTSVPPASENKSA